MTEGTPARALTDGTKTRRTAGGAISAKKIAHARPRGPPIAIAPTVTMSDPTMIGNIPHAPLARLSVGTHLLVVRKLGPTSIRKGTPLLKTKTMIKKIAQTVEIAHNSKISWMKRPLISLVPNRSIVLSSSFGLI
jgi:hypothetical protein